MTRISKLRQIVNLANDFHVGRSHFPEQRLLYHVKSKARYNHLAVVKWVCGQKNASEEEEKLCDMMHALLRGSKRTCNDVSYEDDGRFKGDWHCVYVAFRIRERTKFPTGVRVSGLSYDRRSWPQKSLSAPIIYYSDLSTAAAQRAIDCIKVE